MGFRNGLAVAAAATAIALGAGFGLRRRAVVHDSLCLRRGAQLAPTFAAASPKMAERASDFIALAAYQLGPEKPIAMPPANLSMPAPVDPHNVYAGAGRGMFSPAVAGQPTRVYSPNLITGQVDVIDPETFKVIDSLAAIRARSTSFRPGICRRCGFRPTSAMRGGHGGVMPIDPKTGKVGKEIDVPDSYNIYFTPDGKSAIVVAEAMRRLEFRDPHTMELQGYITTPQCAGINHADFSPDGSYAIFTCEFNNSLAKIDLVHHTLVDTLPLTPGHMPQDIRVAPDGKFFFIADLCGDGVMRDRRRFVRAGRFHQDRRRRARALSKPRRDEALRLQSRHPQPRRRAKRRRQRIGDRLRQRKVVANWTIPGGGSPDMGNLSADGKWLWLSGRYDGVIYAFNTDDGSVKSIPVGGMPHGLTVWPQPGRYSLGHTGNMR